MKGSTHDGFKRGDSGLRRGLILLEGKFVLVGNPTVIHASYKF